MLQVIQSRGLPLDRITTTDVWATDTIPANFPPMQAFKDRMDERIWDMYRIEVEHLCALNKDGTKKTYEQMFYHVPVRRSQTVKVERERERERPDLRSHSVNVERERESKFRPGTILGFPDLYHPWCQAGLKRNATHQVTGNHQGVPPIQQTVPVVSEAQACLGSECKGFRYKSLPGAASSRSISSEPLFLRPAATTGKEKYRGIPGHCCRRAKSFRPAQPV